MKTTAEFLRALADFYDANPLCPEPEISIYLHADKAKEVLRNLGSFEKDYDDSYMYARVKVGDRTLKLSTQRDAVCTRKVVGTREVPEEVIPSTYTPEEVIPAHTAEIIEWECDPILAREMSEAA